jgi:hypothetical protein
MSQFENDCAGLGLTRIKIDALWPSLRVVQIELRIKSKKVLIHYPGDSPYER